MGFVCLISQKHWTPDKKAYEFTFFFVSKLSLKTKDNRPKQTRGCGNNWFYNRMFRIIKNYLKQTKSPAILEVEYQNLQDMH